MKVLVCGGRDYNNRAVVFSKLQDIDRVEPISLIIHGGAKGADTLAGAFGAMCNIPITEEKVDKSDWEKHGKKAGVLRNQKMLDAHKPDLVVAFPGGKGTADMVRRAKKANVKVVEVNHD